MNPPDHIDRATAIKWNVGDRIVKDGKPGVVLSIATAFSIYYQMDHGAYGGCLNYCVQEDTNMARTKKDTAPKVDKSARDLLDMALNFCRPGFKADGEPYAQYAFIFGKWITTYNGVVMYGHPIADELQCLPHFGKLDSAIRGAGTGLALTQIAAGRLQVKGASLRVAVPCLEDPSLVARQMPDNPMVAIDNVLRKAFENVRAIPVGDRVIQQSVLLDSSIITGTDLVVMAQFYHGVHLPKLSIPVEFVKAVLGVAKNIVSIGWSDRSFTVWFEAPEGQTSNPFMRTQLYTEEWPDISGVIDVDYNQCRPVPDGFFEALEKILPFTDDDSEAGYVIFANDMLKTSAVDDHGAEMKLPGLVAAENTFDIKRILKCKGRFTHMDCQSDPTQMRFTGPNYRGVLMANVVKPKTGGERRQIETPQPSGAGAHYTADLDDDIPF